MKKFIIILMLVMLSGCGDEKETSSEILVPPVEAGTSQEQAAKEEVIPEADPNPKAEKEETEEDAEEQNREEVAVAFNGKYRKMIEDRPAADCNCQCIDISFEKDTEWCIVQDKVYISGRSKKTGDNTADIFLTGVTRDDNADRPLPWEKFDRDVPVASVVFQKDGTAELDWLGFSIDGELARDYAIYGKKTLEGTYIKD